MTAAFSSHAPALGTVTVHPTPTTPAPAALAHDLLRALGKPLFPTADEARVWADHTKRAWNAAGAWITAMAIDHVIVTRAHHVTVRNWRNLLALQRDTGTRPTLLLHGPSPGHVPTTLRDITHRVVHDVGSAQAHLRATRSPATRGARPGPSCVLVPRETEPWLALPPPSKGTPAPVPRGPRRPCPADPQAHVPPRPGRRPTSDEYVAIHRVQGRVAHPHHAAAIALMATMGNDLDELRRVSGNDVSRCASTVVVHERAHRRCRAYPVSEWARPLLSAARVYNRLEGHSDDASLFHLLPSERAAIAESIALCRLRLRTGRDRAATPVDDTRSRR